MDISHKAIIGRNSPSFLGAKTPLQVTTDIDIDIKKFEIVIFATITFQYSYIYFWHEKCCIYGMQFVG